MGYDYHVLNKFWPSIWNRTTVKFKNLWDTFVQSKCQHFDRHFVAGVKSNHSLEYYGVLFGYPKPQIDDWTYWDEAKLDRVLKDIEINRKTYHYLNDEASKIELTFVEQIRRTQAAQYWYALQEQYGTFGNKALMLDYVKDLDTKIEELRESIEPNLPYQVKPNAVKCTWEELRDYWPQFFKRVPATKTDKKGAVVKPAYKPTYKITMANGDYPKAVAKYFDIPQDKKASDYMVAGAYTKVSFEPAKMSQHAVVKQYLLDSGWKPTQWNYEKGADGSFLRNKGELIKKSPKLTEDSFDSIEGEIGNNIALYNTLVHRRRTFMNEKDSSKGWVNQLREDTQRIPAGALAWQTGTGRAAQFGIVNVPSASAVYGAPMREVWKAPEGKILISVDQDAAQIRLLANYMKDDEYTQAVLHGEEFDANHKYVGTDVHTLNAIAFGKLDPELRQKAVETQDSDLIKLVSSIRKICKNGFYALLFGAGDEKLAATVKDSGGAKAGKIMKSKFMRKLSGVETLQRSLKDQWEENSWKKGGYIEVAGNTFVWVPSEHKLLNYLLMGSEAVLQNQAICWVNAQMSRRKLNGQQLLSIHDELTFEFPEDEREEGIKLLSEMYGQASVDIGLDVIVTGTAQAGKTWLDIH